MSRKTERPRIDQLELGEWLYDLLAQVRRDVARKPSASAIERIRARLQSEMEQSEKAAA